MTTSDLFTEIMIIRLICSRKIMWLMELYFLHRNKAHVFSSIVQRLLKESKFTLSLKKCAVGLAKETLLDPNLLLHAIHRWIYFIYLF